MYILTLWILTQQWKPRATGDMYICCGTDTSSIAVPTVPVFVLIHMYVLSMAEYIIIQLFGAEVLSSVPQYHMCRRITTFHVEPCWSYFRLPVFREIKPINLKLGFYRFYRKFMLISAPDC